MLAEKSEAGRKASIQSDPSRELLCTGFPFRDLARLTPYMALFQELFLTGQRGGRTDGGLLGDGTQALGPGGGHLGGGDSTASAFYQAAIGMALLTPC